MSDSAVLTTAMSSMSMAVAAQTTARVQRWVVVKVGSPGVVGRSDSHAPGGAPGVHQGFP